MNLTLDIAKAGTIKSAIDDVVKPITTLKPDGRWELKDKPTRQELDQFIANVKAKADAAKLALPSIEAAEGCSRGVLHLGVGLAMAPEVVEVKLV